MANTVPTDQLSNDLTPYAQWKLGQAYEKDDTKWNPEKAFSCYKKAADSNFGLGNCYLKGIGTPKDFQKAFAFMKRSKEHGEPLGEYGVGYCLLNGYGVPKDNNQGIQLLESAAEKKVGLASNDLGFCYQHGYGVSSDPDTAIKYFKEAVALNVPEAHYNLGHLYSSGYYTIDLDRVCALHHFNKAAESRLPSALTAAANILMDPRDARISKDTVHALELYRKAAQLGDATAMYNLGFSYFYGVELVPPDFYMAAHWIVLSAEKGNATAIKHINTDKGTLWAIE